ncbi:kinase-like protein [Piedraia hortae CBS 480.64]|uniref:non-specific serine/threonine protein kinase n=1 Tax=Piedraia hortae CBS 480.64 TaxID=1314780 RepID=A0A6A7BZC2_9PEZI|nr:kinase-like protein [Piedraia hortae CBS 480.64]
MSWAIAISYYRDGDLHAYLTSRIANSGTQPPEPLSKKLAIDMATALGFMHLGIADISQKPVLVKGHIPILHRDLKPENVFVRIEDSVPKFVLADFGLANFLPEAVGVTGTPGYIAPECQKVSDELDEEVAERVRVHTAKSDVYSFGAILWSAVTGLPFDNLETRYSLKRMGKHLKKIGVEATGGTVGALVLGCLEKEPAERLGTEQLVGFARRFKGELGPGVVY